MAMSLSAQFDPKAWLSQTTADIRESFARNRRGMSFGEYFTLFVHDTPPQGGSAARYLRDVSAPFGTVTVRSPRGILPRWKLFDCPWDNGDNSLKGQEEVQASVYRLVSNFAREGRTNRLILLHGP